MSDRTRLTVGRADAQAEPDDATWQVDCVPELLEGLRALLAGLDKRPDTMADELQQLEAEHGERVYSELLWLLSHLRFPACEAKPHCR